MTDTERRYKNTLSKVKSVMAKYSRRIYFNNPDIERYGGEGDIPKTYVLLDGDLSGINCYLRLVAPFKFKVSDNNGVLYIGQDISQVQLYEFNSYGNSFVERMSHRLYQRQVDASDIPLADTIYNEIQSRNSRYLPDKESLYTSNPEILELFNLSPTYRTYYGKFNKVISNAKPYLELKSGIHKDCKDRQIFPYLIFDTEASKVTYIDGIYSQTSRQNRKTVSYEYFMNNLDQLTEFSMIFAPLTNFTELQLSAPGIKVYSYSGK